MALKSKMVNFVVVAALFLPLQAIAAMSWQIVTEKSSLSFTATQNASPVTGQFKSFSGVGEFDPNQLANAKVKVVVDVGSVYTSYGQVAATLKTPDWFDVKKYPQAVFVADSFTKTGNMTYQAKGKLTLRNITQPITLDFALVYFNQDGAQAKGRTVFKRSAFGVGSGEWSSTKEIKDEVEVNFTAVAVRR